MAYFPYVTFVSVVSFNDVTIPAFCFCYVELVSPYNKKNITRWLEDMNFMFSWQEQYLTSERSERVRYCSCHSNIKFISSRHRVISSIYEEDENMLVGITLLRQDVLVAEVIIVHAFKIATEQRIE